MRRRPWGASKPPPWVPADPDTLAAYGVAHLFGLPEGGGRLVRDAATARTSLGGAIIPWAPTPYGPGLKFTDTTGENADAGTSRVSTGPLTLFLLAKAAAGSNNGTARYGVSVSVVNSPFSIVGLGWSGSTGVPTTGWFNGSSTTVTGTAVGADVWTPLVAVHASATDRRLYQPRAKTSYTTNSAFPTAMTNVYVGTSPNLAGWGFQTVALAGVASAAWTDAMAAAWIADPYLFWPGPKVTRVSVPSGAVGGVASRRTLSLRTGSRGAF